MLQLLAFWIYVAFTVEKRWTFSEVTVELLSRYLGLTYQLFCSYVEGM